MKLTTFVIVLFAAAALIMGTLYWAHPRERIVEKPVPMVTYLPAKPDTVYQQRIKFVPVPSKPDTEYVLIQGDTAAAETIVSEKEFSQQSAFGEIKSLVRNYGPCMSTALSDSIYFPGGEFAAMEKIKKQVAEEIKPKSKFWPGVAVGVVVVLGIGLADRWIK